MLDGHLKGRAWMLGDTYGIADIADIAIFPWVRNLIGFCEAAELGRFERFTQVQRGLQVPAAA